MGRLTLSVNGDYTPKQLRQFEHIQESGGGSVCFCKLPDSTDCPIVLFEDLVPSRVDVLKNQSGSTKCAFPPKYYIWLSKSTKNNPKSCGFLVHCECFDIMPADGSTCDRYEHLMFWLNISPKMSLHINSTYCDWSARTPLTICIWVLCVFMCTLIYNLFKIKQIKEQVAYHLVYYTS